MAKGEMQEGAGVRRRGYDWTGGAGGSRRGQELKGGEVGEGEGSTVDASRWWKRGRGRRG